MPSDPCVTVAMMNKELLDGVLDNLSAADRHAWALRFKRAQLQCAQSLARELDFSAAAPELAKLKSANKATRKAFKDGKEFADRLKTIDKSLAAGAKLLRALE